METPMNALMHAIMTVRYLPPAQRETWREVFRHYVFEADETTAGHIPEDARRLLSPLDEPQARELRALLLPRRNRRGKHLQLPVRYAGGIAPAALGPPGLDPAHDRKSVGKG